jgi:pSer/pThr/pTyr-binding forkhead associated (FHA) protein
MKVNLVLLKVGGNNKAFSLPSTVTIVGRRQECDLCIPLSVISRRHCALNMDDGKLSIRDLGSSNGTFVNGKQVDEADLAAGDKVSVGPLNFVVQIDGVPAEIVGDEAMTGLAGGMAKVKTEGADLIDSAAPDESQHNMHNTEIINAPHE